MWDRRRKNIQRSWHWRTYWTWWKILFARFFKNFSSRVFTKTRSFFTFIQDVKVSFNFFLLPFQFFLFFFIFLSFFYIFCFDLIFLFYTRPEFVKNYKKSLCPDSFSRFLTKEHSFQFNKDVEEASNYLHSFVIPLFTETLISEIRKFSYTRKDLSTFPLMKIVNNFFSQILIF
jgi:hypothetical protein